MAATPLTLMDGGITSAAVAADVTTAAVTSLEDDGIRSSNTIATSPSSIATKTIRPTMLFGSSEMLDTTSSTLVSPNGSGGSGSGNSAATSPSFLPDMPQWKKDLIQRRKTNVARTIGAAAAGVVLSPTSSAATQQQQRAGQTSATNAAADGFSPTTITPNRDLCAIASKSGISTTPTKVNKVTASQQQQQQQQQQKHATVITAEQEQMSLIIKMPTATNTATVTASPTAPPTTIVSPIPRASKRNTPTSSNNSSPTKEKTERILYGGGHYTPTAALPQASRERRESGGDRKDWVLSPTRAMPIPKQRSAYSPVKNSATTLAAAKENQQEIVSEQRGGSSGAITRLTGTTSAPAAKGALREVQQQSNTDGGVAGAADGVDGKSNTAVGAGSSAYVEGECDGVNEMQENEVGEESCGTYAASNKQIQSTTQASSPTSRAHKSASTLPLSPLGGAMQANHTQSTQQFHSKSERERTYTEQRGTSSTLTGYKNSSNNIATTNRVQTKNSNNPYSATSSSYSPSNYVIPPSSSSGTTTGSGGGSGKIFSKLHNNQFIKNQQQQHQQLQQSGTQPSAAQQTNITARYLKYKSAHAQEAAGAAGGVGSETGSTSNYTALPGAYSPTKTFVAPTAIAIQKKKMVSVQEMKKTTQSSVNHAQRVGGAGTAAVAGGGTCARPLALSGSGQRARAPSQTEEMDFDPAEDLSYGPGIVSKLRCRYLSLAFRESMEKERHCLDNMRRATSLNNLLDRDETADDDDDETEDDLDGESGGEAIDVEVNEGDDNAQDEEASVELRAGTAERKLKAQGGILKHSSETAGAQDCIKKTTTFQKQPKNFTTNGARHMQSPAGGASGTPTSGNTSTPDTPRSRHLKRGNDSLKRARSVEALLCERSPWQYVALNRTSYQPTQRSGQYASSNTQQQQPTCVTIEDKINNARSRLILGTDSMPPKRLTSVIDDTERPPPDLVKQTLKKFEATANRRGRGPNRTNGTGEVASKVATYKTIIKENKPAIVFPKPPLSPTKKLSAPLLTKPAAKPVVGASDLLSSPLGRKATANAAATITPGKSATPTSNVATVAAVLTPNSGVGGGLSEHSPDIFPTRQKLLMENVDTPVTALTKKLEKLRVDSVDNTPPTKTKEVKQTPAQLNKQLTAHSVNDNEFVNNSEFSNDKQASGGGEGGGGGTSNSALVCGASAGEAASVGDAALEGNNENSTNKAAAKQHNDRAGTSASGGGESFVEHDSVQAGTATTAISSDLSDDEDGLLASAPTTKRITRTALDNIARAGTTQQFKFAGGGKSLLEQKSKTDIPTSVLNAAPGKQIGVIRPLLTTTAAQQGTNTHTNISNQQQLLQQHMEALKQHNVYHNNTTTTPTAAAATTHSSIYHSPQQLQLTSREIEKNRINEMKKTAGVLADVGGVGSPVAASANVSASLGATAAAANASLNNVINTNVKSSSSAHAASSTSGAAGLSPSTSGFTELDAAAQANNSPLWALRIKRQTPPSVAQENTSMVFNFSNRKEVPDYIENDGVIFRRKRELPKPNESGFVLLGDLSLETSTDSDYDDFSMCPPSPCDVEFENANIVIDGKSSIRQKPKEATFRVQFNDTLTSTFEYPSEASLIIEDPYSNESLISAYENDSTDTSPARHHHVAVDEIIQLPTPPANSSSPANNLNNSNNGGDGSVSGSTTNTPTKNMLGNLPLVSAASLTVESTSNNTTTELPPCLLECFDEHKKETNFSSAPLGFYTPVKAPIENLFQLGVTRAPNGNGPHCYNNNTSTPTTNGASPQATNKNTGIIKQNGQTNGSSGGSERVNSSNGGSKINNAHADEAENGDEMESLQYIKPANDDLTMAYSEGTQKTDLLY